MILSYAGSEKLLPAIRGLRFWQKKSSAYRIPILARCEICRMIVMAKSHNSRPKVKAGWFESIGGHRCSKQKQFFRTSLIMGMRLG